MKFFIASFHYSFIYIFSVIKLTKVAQLHPMDIRQQKHAIENSIYD